MGAQFIQKTRPLSISRPGNTTAYVAGDVIAGDTVLLPNEVRINVEDSFNAWIVGGQAVSNAAQSSLQFDVLFFNTSFAVEADNALFDPSDDELKDYYLGRISFSSFVSYMNNSVCDGMPASTKPIIITPDSQTIYFVLVATAAYTPAANEVITLKFDYQKAY
jgi:hypothetical protein